MSSTVETETRQALAERVRKALMEAAASAYEDARISGLCGEGAWEIAYGTMRDLKLAPAVKASQGD